MTSESQNSAIVPTGHDNATEEKSAQQASDHTTEAHPGTVDIASVGNFAMTAKLRLTKVDERNSPQLTKFPGTATTNSDMQMLKWEDTKWPNLHLAVRRGDMQAIKESIQLGADVNAKNRNNETPIFNAAASKVDGNMTYDILKYLVENGADVFVTDSKGHTFLHKLLLNSTSSSSGFGDFAQFLVENNLSSLFDTQDVKLWTTPLMLAARNMELEMATISLLKENGVDFTLADKNGSSYLSYAVEGNKNGKLLAELKENGDIQHHKLAEAIDAMDINSMKVLVSLGAGLNETNNDLETPLHLAAWLKSYSSAIKIIKFLIDSGANVDAKDKNGNIFLHLLVGWTTSIANSTQFDDIATYLISMGLSRLFNTPKMDLVTSFHETVRRVEIERKTLSLFKSNGVDFNAADSGGCSVLYWAMRGDRTLRMISDLVDLGANPNHLTTDKVSMLHSAAYNANTDVAKFFIDKGLDINAQDYRGKTPLHYTIQWSKKDVLKTVQLLLQNGAKSDMVDENGKSPRDYFNENRDKYFEADQISTSFSLG